MSSVFNVIIGYYIWIWSDKLCSQIETNTWDKTLFQESFQLKA